MVAGAVVALYDHPVDLGAFSFIDPHFDVDRIVIRFNFNGFDIEEKIPVVHIQGADIGAGRVERQPFLNKLHVVNIAPLHPEHLVEYIFAINEISRPGNVAEIVFMSLLQFDVYVDFPVADRIDGIAHNEGIPKAFGIVVVNNSVFVGLVFALLEL